MLRAVRFAARFQFDIDPETEASIVRESHRLNLLIEGPVVSAERIREEFTRILMGPAPVQGLRKLHSLGILRQFAPEISAMEGVEQNEWHLYDVWEHTLKAVEAMVTANREASLVERLAILFHDIGKGPTKTEDESGIHFYNHQFVGAKMTATIMNRLKFSNQVVDDVTRLVELHMRLGEYKPEWGDSAIRRLIRSIYPHKEPLFRITAADMAAMRQDVPTGDLVALRERMDRVDAAGMMALFDSPLDGLEIMEVLSIGPGPILKEAKDFLINQVLEGLLGATDKDLSRKQLKEWYARR